MALALSGRKCRLPPETDCQEDSVLHLAPSKHTLPEEAHPPFCAGRKLRDIDKALLWNILHEDPECPTRALLDKVAQSQVPMAVSVRHRNRLRAQWNLNRGKGRPTFHRI